MTIAVIPLAPSLRAEVWVQQIIRAGLDAELVPVHAKCKQLKQFSGYFIVGDPQALFPQSMLAHFFELTFFLKEQDEQGKLILGMGAGAQLLVDSGLVPGLMGYQIGIGVARWHGAANTTIQLNPRYQLNAFTQKMRRDWCAPIVSDSSQMVFILPPVLAQEIRINGLDVFWYGAAQDPACAATAAIANKAGNILACLPDIEPEYFHPVLESLCAYVKAGVSHKIRPIAYQPRLPLLRSYNSKVGYAIKAKTSETMTALQVLADALAYCKLPVAVTCDILQPIGLNSLTCPQALCSLSEIRDSRFSTPNRLAVLAYDKQVGADADYIPQQAVLWHVAWQDQDEGIVTALLETGLLFNPYAYHYYRY